MHNANDSDIVKAHAKELWQMQHSRTRPPVAFPRQQGSSGSKGGAGNKGGKPQQQS